MGMGFNLGFWGVGSKITLGLAISNLGTASREAKQGGYNLGNQ